MSVISYKCPNCDGELIFDPVSGQYKCEYCFSLFSQDKLDAMEPAKGGERKEEETETFTQDEYSKNNETEQGVIYTCPSCGAEIVTDETTAATFCYYCHNPVVLGGRLGGEYLPDSIIPFAIDKKMAVERFLEYVKKKKFIPRAFFNKKQIEKIAGIYFPYWVYDAAMEGTMHASATKVRVWVAGDEEFTETRFYEVERKGDVNLTGITENALKKAGNILSQRVLPYTLEEAKEFSFGYLSGFFAEKRDIEQREVEDIFLADARKYGEELLRGTVKGYGSVTGVNSSFHMEEETYRYVLLPVWTLTYKGKNGKMYYYSMNGQTGKVCGELPVDHKKVIGTAGIVTFLVWLLCMIGGYFIW